MTNSKSTKRALLGSVLSLTVCCAMLIGTTFAWFTDSVISGGNQIVAGRLKADLIHVGGGEDGSDISIKETPDHKIFDYDKWEPGYTAMETLKVVNNGNLAFKFRLDAVAAGATPKKRRTYRFCSDDGCTAHAGNRRKRVSGSDPRQS